MITKNIPLYLSLILIIMSPSLSKADCFLAKEKNRIIEQEGNCTTRQSPCSTFKIAISLMGYNEGLLLDEHRPLLPFQKGYADAIKIWKAPHTPKLWMQNSCVWYSQVLTKEVGHSQFKKYVSKFNYGNQNLSGDKGKNNGLTHSWLSSSLEISPQEQIIFLQKLINNQLPVSLDSQEKTKQLLYVKELNNGWTLYGKTGSGSLLNKTRTEKTDLQIGWFVGWIQKDNRNIAFVQFLKEDEKKEGYASLRAKAMAIKKLNSITK